MWFSLEIIGLAGLIILVCVFLLQSLGIFRQKETTFYGFNTFGAALLTYYATSIGNPYFAVLESIWCAGAAVSLGTIYWKRLILNHKTMQQQG